MLRLAMIVTMTVASPSKFLSHGAFAAYYLQAFTKPGLRIHLPTISYSAYLAFMSFFEFLLGVSFLWTRYKRYSCWVEIPHYSSEGRQLHTNKIL